MTNYVNVVFLNMEYGIHEQISKNHDDGFTIFLNARDSYEMQKESYIHALKEHIQNDDHSKYDVQEIEHNAHKH